MNEQLVTEEPKRYTVVEYLEMIRDRNICVPVALIANSSGGSDPARFIPLESLNVVIAQCAKVPFLEGRVADLETQLAKAKKSKRKAPRKTTPVFKPPAKRKR